MITQNKLKELLSYDPETGVFRWKVRRKGSRKGGVGTTGPRGYITITIDGVKYYAHRLAWFYETGRWPKLEIDHISGVKADNRIRNLREATRSQNAANIKSRRNGLKGCCFVAALRKWQVAIRTRTGRLYLGLFDTEQLAHAAYMDAATRIHGEFARAA